MPREAPLLTKELSNEITIVGPQLLDRVTGGHRPCAVRDALTVISRTPARLYALERDDFLETVTGHPESTATADAVTQARYEDKRAEIARAPQNPASTPVGNR
jgi:hypothetical protein